MGLIGRTARSKLCVHHHPVIIIVIAHQALVGECCCCACACVRVRLWRFVESGCLLVASLVVSSMLGSRSALPSHRVMKCSIIADKRKVLGLIPGGHTLGKCCDAQWLPHQLVVTSTQKTCWIYRRRHLSSTNSQMLHTIFPVLYLRCSTHKTWSRNQKCINLEQHNDKLCSQPRYAESVDHIFIVQFSFTVQFTQSEEVNY